MVFRRYKNVNCWCDNTEFRFKGESVDLCSTVQWKSPICAGESTTFLTTDDSLQSFFTFRGKNYFSLTFLMLVIDFLLFFFQGVPLPKLWAYLFCDGRLLNWIVYFQHHFSFSTPAYMFSYYFLHQGNTSSSSQFKFAPHFTQRIELYCLTLGYQNNSGGLRKWVLLSFSLTLQPQAFLRSSEYWIIYTKQMALLGWVGRSLPPRQQFGSQYAHLPGETQICVLLLTESG